MTKDDCIKLLKEYMDVLKVDYGIKSISLFGSTARGEQTVDSDIDLFVDTQTPYRLACRHCAKPSAVEPTSKETNRERCCHYLLSK